MADPEAYSVFDTPYNYMSVMHYSSSGFAIDKSEPTIITKGIHIKIIQVGILLFILDPFYQTLIGQRASYTTEDTDNINLLYSYSDTG